MPNLVNELLVKNYIERFKNCSSFIAVGYEGMDAKTTTAFRALLAAKKMRMTFVRNRLFRLAVRQLGRPDVKPLCRGQTAVVDGEDPIAVARFLVEFQKENKALKIHGALLDNAVLEGAAAVELAKCPSQAELRAMIVGQILAPARQVIGALLAPARRLAGAVQAQAEKEESKAKENSGASA
ncbi:MAG: 50S ribosomal protein L10 [Planctomycetota bacterium]|nr:50S ribosomal protein L10 [Planctomycetota bacterium]